MKFLAPALAIVAAALVTLPSARAADPPRHVVLVMADDWGWGQTGYYDHPVLETPHLDAMAEVGLRFDRFYAAGPVCSPTRASVMTGRTHKRSGVPSHGYGLRKQEKTIAFAMREAGFSTGHFGKWHLNGLRGPGVPILGDDEYGPGGFGFETWISVTNFFDLDPVMSRNGEFEEFAGDSSEIIVDQALQFIGAEEKAGNKSFSVVWYGTPHSPFRALEADKAGFPQDGSVSVDHYGELVAMDRSLGTIRAGLRELGIAEDTLLWFCSDNGGLPGIKPETVGGLRGFKGSVYEGGIRVPCVVEWPRGIAEARATAHPAGTVDIFPTIIDILGLDPAEFLLQPQDGISLAGVFAADGPAADDAVRDQPLGFHYRDHGAWVDGDLKLVMQGPRKQAPADPRFALYDLSSDHAEATDLSAERPEVLGRMKAEFLAWSASVEASIAGEDYPEGEVTPVPPSDTFWTEVDAYAPYFDAWRERPEYSSRLKKKE